MRPNWLIISSVSPSLKYSCPGSPVKFSKGLGALLKEVSGGKQIEHRPLFEDALKTTGNEGKFVVKELIELIREAVPSPHDEGALV